MNDILLIIGFFILGVFISVFNFRISKREIENMENINKFFLGYLIKTAISVGFLFSAYMVGKYFSSNLVMLLAAAALGVTLPSILLSLVNLRDNKSK